MILSHHKASMSTDFVHWLYNPSWEVYMPQKSYVSCNAMSVIFSFYLFTHLQLLQLIEKSQEGNK
jgi:hypothetical protein